MADFATTTAATIMSGFVGLFNDVIAFFFATTAGYIVTVAILVFLVSLGWRFVKSGLGSN
jgi:hypothetical protein